LFKSQELAGGTAFYYQYNGGFYLVTNWHNVTGRDPKTKQPKHSQAAIPDVLKIYIPSITGDKNVKFFEAELDLYQDEDCQLPIWWEHPLFSQKVDLVVIPMGTSPLGNSYKGSRVVTVNEPSVSCSEVPFGAGQDVFTLGFPRLMDGEGLAIWKRGSIATEPSLDLGGLPKIYIDTATREGMSGAPVFANGLISVRVSGQQISGLAHRNRFLGIYSGRVGDDTFLAQLGVVWKECAIIDTIKAEHKGQTSF
jgi:hypothetical protein